MKTTKITNDTKEDHKLLYTLKNKDYKVDGVLPTEPYDHMLLIPGQSIDLDVSWHLLVPMMDPNVDKVDKV